MPKGLVYTFTAYPDNEANIEAIVQKVKPTYMSRNMVINGLILLGIEEFNRRLVDAGFEPVKGEENGDRS